TASRLLAWAFAGRFGFLSKASVSTAPLKQAVCQDLSLATGHAQGFNCLKYRTIPPGRRREDCPWGAGWPRCAATPGGQFFPGLGQPLSARDWLWVERPSARGRQVHINLITCLNAQLTCPLHRLAVFHPAGADVVRVIPSRRQGRRDKLADRA